MHSTSRNQIYGLLNTASLLGKNMIDMLEEKLEGGYEWYIKTKRHYEEEMKKNYVLERIRQGLDRGPSI